MAQRDPRQFRDPPSVRRRKAHPFDEPAGATAAEPEVAPQQSARRVARPKAVVEDPAPQQSPTPSEPASLTAPQQRTAHIELQDLGSANGAAKRTRVTRGTGEVVRRQTFWLTEADIEALEDLRLRVRVPGLSGVPDKSALVREAIRRLVEDASV